MGNCVRPPSCKFNEREMYTPSGQRIKPPETISKPHSSSLRVTKRSNSGGPGKEKSSIKKREVSLENGQTVKKANTVRRPLPEIPKTTNQESVPAKNANKGVGRSQEPEEPPGTSKRVCSREIFANDGLKVKEREFKSNVENEDSKFTKNVHVVEQGSASCELEKETEKSLIVLNAENCSAVEDVECGSNTRISKRPEHLHEDEHLYESCNSDSNVVRKKGTTEATTTKESKHVDTAHETRTDDTLDYLPNERDPAESVTDRRLEKEVDKESSSKRNVDQAIVDIETRISVSINDIIIELETCDGLREHSFSKGEKALQLVSKTLLHPNIKIIVTQTDGIANELDCGSTENSSVQNAFGEDFTSLSETENIPCKIIVVERDAFAYENERQHGDDSLSNQNIKIVVTQDDGTTNEFDCCNENILFASKIIVVKGNAFADENERQDDNESLSNHKIPQECSCKCLKSEL